MKQIRTELSSHAWMTGFIHEPNPEMPNHADFPAILVLPGGGFRFCSAREGEPVAAAFYAAGYSSFVLDYTTVTKKPDAVIDDPMKDTELALRWIREHAAEYALRGDQVAMIGFSGGSHLAAAVATHGPERPDALILGYPGILHSKLRALECPDIIECVDENTPPTFMFSTRDDKVTPPKHPLAMANALDAAGVSFEMHIFRSGPHGLSLANDVTCAGNPAMVNPAFAGWLTMCLEWLKAEMTCKK